VLEATTEKAWNGGEALHAALGAAGVSATVWWRPLHGVARAVGGAREPWPATVFEQVNTMVGSMVRKAAVAGVDLSPGMGDPISAPGSRVPGREAALVWDLYSGIGESTAMLADLGLAVQSVELDPRAVELATRLGPAGPERFAGAVEGHLRRLKSPAAVLTNPPRAGMSAAVTSAILSSGARRVVYVSCDPATLARDLSRLGAGYRLAAVKAFDQFPQTSHVETVVSLERR
jgi:23S rRNA (uracil1939-C5)-methyltransferase